MAARPGAGDGSGDHRRRDRDGIQQAQTTGAVWLAAGLMVLATQERHRSTTPPPAD
ncbi:hypothetical protein ABZ313_35065 [Streptomyces sp. NPDC006251]|uniref:hypothetical protein n=1 Tax=Streptomyces sp. NPDC006251 TaxID=3155718 RepID=UPI0033B0F3DE